MPIARGRQVVLGFSEAGSHDLVDLTECAILDPALFAAVAPLRVLLAGLMTGKRRVEVQMAAVDQGIDLAIDGRRGGRAGGGGGDRRFRAAASCGARLDRQRPRSGDALGTRRGDGDARRRRGAVSAGRVPPGDAAGRGGAGRCGQGRDRDAGHGRRSVRRDSAPSRSPWRRRPRSMPPRPGAMRCWR